MRSEPTTAGRGVSAGGAVASGGQTLVIRPGPILARASNRPHLPAVWGVAEGGPVDFGVGRVGGADVAAEGAADVAAEGGADALRSARPGRVVPVAGVPCAVRAVGGARACQSGRWSWKTIRRRVSRSGAVQPVTGPPRSLPAGSAVPAATLRPRRDSRLCLLFRDEAGRSVLGTYGPLGMVLDEAFLPDDFIKRQTHHNFPCLTVVTLFGPCPVRVSTGHGHRQHFRPLVHACTWTSNTFTNSHERTRVVITFCLISTILAVTINPLDPVPVYKQLAAILRARIERNEFPPRQPLPVRIATDGRVRRLAWQRPARSSGACRRRADRHHPRTRDLRTTT